MSVSYHVYWLYSRLFYNQFLYYGGDQQCQYQDLSPAGSVSTFNGYTVGFAIIPFFIMGEILPVRSASTFIGYTVGYDIIPLHIMGGDLTTINFYRLQRTSTFHHILDTHYPHTMILK